ncbi:MAG TPA: metalloregulator ArsR/SmtB family transcription factor [Thermomicrobiaceae bacterium]|nr:metalloregulator ArsR/SmtB family transcription factor [Thermomicrobiaceae bacterium]
MARPKRVDQLREVESLALCDDPIVHVDAVRNVRANQPPSSSIARLSSLFGALGDPTRLRIVSALSQRELCVCDIAASLGISQSAISHQMRLLRDLGLVRSRRDGRLVYYALDDEHVTTLFQQAKEHVEHLEGER